MQEPILKAVAMPPRIFWAPMMLAVANLIVQFTLMLLYLALFQGNIIWFIATIAIVHAFLVAHSTYDPHLYLMIVGWFQSRPHMTKNTYPTRGAKFAP